MLTAERNGDLRPVLMDFGIASADGQANELPRHPLQVGGSTGYVAPEQTFGRPSAASDVYSLGVVIHEMITGKRPLQQPTNGAPVPKLPRRWESVIRQCLQPEQKDRFQSAADLLQTLDRGRF